MNKPHPDSLILSLVPPPEKPRERCLERGPSCLSLRECLALLLGSGPQGTGCLGLVQKILARPGKGLGTPEEERAFFMGIECCGRSHLLDIPGLGPAGQARILAAVEVGRRYALFRGSHPPPHRTKQASKTIHPQGRLALQAL
jgi:DNA repair protein RadC